MFSVPFPVNTHTYSMFLEGQNGWKKKYGSNCERAIVYIHILFTYGPHAVYIARDLYYERDHLRYLRHWFKTAMNTIGVCQQVQLILFTSLVEFQ